MIEKIFALLVIFQIKHFLADYPLQTPYMLRKFLPGWAWVKPLSAHAGVHAFFTFNIAMAFLWHTPGGGVIAIGLAALDFVLHFAMDRVKASPNMLGRFKALSANEYMALSADPPMVLTRGPLEPFLLPVQEGHANRLRKENSYFWWALGLDQAVHHLTHYLIIYILVTH